MDKCARSVGIQPAPAVNFIPGIAFDKESPYNYYYNHDTLGGSFTNPADCCWHNCKLPSSISGSHRNVQMTLAIFVR